MTFFIEIRKINSNVHIELWKTQIAKVILTQNKAAWGITLLDFQLYNFHSFVELTSVFVERYGCWLYFWFRNSYLNLLSIFWLRFLNFPFVSREFITACKAFLWRLIENRCHITPILYWFWRWYPLAAFSHSSCDFPRWGSVTLFRILWDVWILWNSRHYSDFLTQLELLGRASRIFPHWCFVQKYLCIFLVPCVLVFWIRGIGLLWHLPSDTSDSNVFMFFSKHQNLQEACTMLFL